MSDPSANLDTHPDDAERPEILYHYTDINGLLGIVKCCSIWATEIHYLNDSKEYAYAAHLLEKTARSRYESLDDVQSRVLTAFVDSAQMVARTKAFVACFTEERDDLSQWRAYSQSGPGYCIGFDTTKLRQVVVDHDLLFLACEYDEDEQSSLMNTLIDETIAAAPRSMLSVKETENLVMTFSTLYSFMGLATRFKHHKFSAEKEHRIATRFMGGHPELKPELRAAENLLVPYIEIPFTNTRGDLTISEILVGPCPEPALAVSSITELIMSCSVQGTHVSNSEIPFRNW